MELKTASSRYAEFACAFLKLARCDLERAESALERKDWADSIFRSQQTAEKAVKALLEMHHFFESTHDLSRHFLEIVVKTEKENKEEMNQILEILEWFGGKWQDTRYPHLTRGKVILPEDLYGEKQGTEAYEKAHFVYDTISKLLHKRYNLSL